MHMSRPLSHQLLILHLSAVVLNLQHTTAFLHSNVRTQSTHECDWCQRRDELMRPVGTTTRCCELPRNWTPSPRPQAKEAAPQHHNSQRVLMVSRQREQYVHTLDCFCATPRNTRRNHVCPLAWEMKVNGKGHTVGTTTIR